MESSVQYEDMAEWTRQYTSSDVEKIHSATCITHH